MIREFDERFIVPIFKYEKLEDYYHEAALYYKIDRIGVTTLCLNAADDCFAPLESNEIRVGIHHITITNYPELFSHSH